MRKPLTLSEGAGCLHRFRRLAALAPDAAFLRIDGETLSRGEFLVKVALWSGALRKRGVVENDFVALIAPNSLTWCIAFWAIVNLGARPVPLNPQTGSWEIGNILSLIDFRLCIAVTRFRAAEVARDLLQARTTRNSPPDVVCLDGNLPGTIPAEEFLREVSPIPVANRAVAESDWLMLASTSGTTGNPKIIVVPHRGFLRAQLDMAETLELAPCDRMLLGMPLYHQGGLGMGLQALLAGAEVHYESLFDPERFLLALQERHITVAQLSPTLAKLLLSHPRFDEFDLSSLRLAYFAGEVLPTDVAARFWRDKGCRVINVIGSSETGTMVLWDSARDAQRSPAEHCPLPFTQIRVGAVAADAAPRTEPATLWVSTDAVLLEYYGNPAETARRLFDDGQRRWFDTEDLVQALPDGYIRFVGRLKRVIKRGPNLVHPEELETFLLTHPRIAAVAVMREAHELFGESIVAWVQPASGQSLERGDLLGYCRGKIAAYKIPDRFVIVEELPVGMGKIQYKAIRAEHEVS